MKYHWTTKLGAFIIATVFLFAAVASGLGIACLAVTGLYSQSFDEVYDQNIANESHNFAVNLAHRYASLELGGLPEIYLNEYYGDYWLYNSFQEGTWFYTISDSSGKILESTLPEDTSGLKAYQMEITNVGYRQLLSSAIHEVEETTEPTTTPTDPSVATEHPAIIDSVLGTVNLNNLNVHASPSSNSEIVAQLVGFGTEVIILEQEVADGIHWGRIDEGWIDLDYVTIEPAVETDAAYEATVAAVTEPVFYADSNGYTVTSDGVYSDGYWDYENQVFMDITYRQGTMKYCLVTVWLTEDALQETYYWEILRDLTPYNYTLFWVLGLSLLGFVACAVYLCIAAGRTPDSDSIQAGGLNKLPLDLYLAAVFIAECVLLILIGEGFDYMVYEIPALSIPYGVVMLTACCVLAEGFLLALVAQCKMKGGYWWRNTLVGRFVRCCGRWIFRGLKAARDMLPIVARWVGLMLGLALCAFLSLVFWMNAWEPIFQIFWCLVTFGFLGLILAAIGYGAWCFGNLLKGVKNMAQGDLDRKIENPYLRGSFKDMAHALNNLADGARIAAERQMKSERMKTELITNVSHDIKTPLTSIINYVDLLKSAETEESRAQYLEVLDRQSQSLKKLIEDLMDMSKASSGNVTLELTQVDVAEAVNQALGEFADKLDAVSLSPVFRHPEEAVTISADGKHLWRILHNLLSNACKYAMPGTRLYLDLTAQEGRAVLAIKNISKEELNMDAETLLERFVRGDASRNTEGNGLGLNIAQSLTQLQKGTMDILVDGDLFKVTLTFPLA